MSNVDNIITNCFTVVKHGFNFVAFKKAEKRAVTEWKRFQKEAQTEEHRKDQLRLLRLGKADTIALINGFSGLVALDFDSADKNTKPIPASIPQEVVKKLGLPWPYQWAWRSVSGAGWHVWVVVPDLPNNESLRIVSAEKLKEIGISNTSCVRALEIRGWRLCTALPPGVVIPDELPGQVSWNVICTLFGFETRDTVQQKQQNRQLTQRDKHYADAVFRDAIERIKTAPEGERNTTLYYQSRELFRFCLAGALDEQTVTEAIDAASTLRNDEREERERLATIRSAKNNAERLGPRYAPASEKGASIPNRNKNEQNQKQSDESLPYVDAVEQRLIDEGYNFYLNTENGEYFIQYKDSPARRLEDHDLGMFRKWAKNKHYPLYVAELAIIGIADRNKISPVHDGLLSLKWDGKPNIARVASCLRVSENLPQELSEKWLTYWLLKAVGKVVAQEQNIVFVLEGGQGIGKSHFVKWLGDIFPNSYLEEHIDPHNKDCLLDLTRHLVWEICELEKTTRKHDAAALKHFITRSTVTVRPAYGRTTITRPALASLIATTNNPASGYLTDETGNRRFLILPISEIDWSYTKIDPRQVWAEAVYRWKAGERGALSQEDVALRESIAADRMMTGLLDVWLQRYLVITKNEHDILTSADIAEFFEDKNLKIGGTERSQATAIGMAMSRLGIPKERRLLSNGTRLRVWVGVRLNETKSHFVTNNNDKDDNNDDPPDNPSPPLSPNNPPPNGENDGGNGGGESAVIEPGTSCLTARQAQEETMNTHMLENAEDVATALNDIMAQPAVGLDIETTGLDPLEHKIRLVQIATPDRVYMLDAFRTEVRLLKQLFAEEQGPVIAGHNLKFDLAFLRRVGIDAPKGERLFDTILAAKLLSAGEENPRHGLDAVVYRYLNETMSKALQKSNWSVELTPAQLEYAARDAHILLPLRDALMRELDAAKLTDVAMLENRALPAIVWMEDHGVLIDQTAWKKHADTIAAEVLDIEKELLNAAGKSINWRSTQLVLKLLRERGHAIKDTDDDTLKPLAAADNVIKLLLQHREASKKYSAFGHAFLEFVRPDGRIHPDFDQLGAVSGRMTCRKPNLQQIPRKKPYRSCFIAPEGRVLIIADYSQIELRIAADITRDIRMLDAYQRHDDLHALTARLVLGKREVTKEDRQAAKALNFGLIYGMGAARLKGYAANSYGVNLTDEEAVAFRNKFFETYSGIRRWHRRQKQGSEETRTLANRRRLNVEKFQEKLNTPVQGTGADGLKAALGLMWETRVLQPSAVPILAVHDEIVVECDEADANEVKNWIVDCMQRGMEQFVKNVPVEVEAVISQNWSGK